MWAEVARRLLRRACCRGVLDLLPNAVPGASFRGFDAFGFDRLIVVTHHANRRSVRVMEKLGMAFEKRFVHNGVEVVRYARERENRDRES